MPFEIKNGVLRNYREEPGVTEVVIPDGVERIGRCAFLNVRRVIYHGGAKGFPWGAVRGN